MERVPVRGTARAKALAAGTCMPCVRNGRMASEPMPAEKKDRKHPWRLIKKQFFNVYCKMAQLKML